MSFAISSDHAALSRHLDTLFGDLPVTEASAVEVEMSREGDELTVTVEDRTYYRGTDPGVAVANLVSAVNHETVRASNHLLLVHAGAVERDGRAIVFPAAPAAGKSTLVAGLVRRGYGGVTDEVVAFDPESGDVVPYPRPIALKQGSWAVLPMLRPEVEPEVEPYLTEQWFVPPSSIRPGGAGGRSRMVHLVVPRYEAGAPTSMTPVSRAQALDALATSSHNLDHWGTAGFLTLAELVESADCCALTMGSLDGACDAIDRL